jgi:leucyl-tRNA synthetase
MADYQFQEIEKRWQERWSRERTFEAREDDPRPKFYLVEMLPYPSGRIHMGHVRNYSIGDAVARFKRMCGHNVLHPMGWDSFGLPAENAALAHGVHPRQWTEDNIAHMRRQMQALGFAYAWEREIAARRREYYRWNQWLFLQMAKRDLVYRTERLVNWCPSCGTVLANEQVEAGACWRCETAIVQRRLEQWFIRITRYAQELVEGLDRLEGWPERVRVMQRHWLGRSEGAQIDFALEGGEGALSVFTTRLDTIFGATALLLSPEHPDVERLLSGRPERAKVLQFVEAQRAKNPLDRAAAGALKEGIFTGRRALNPYTGRALPVWVANFVLVEYGTGAVMAVPAHDQRDYEFCRALGLPVKTVIRPAGDAPPPEDAAFEADGVLVDSGPFSGLASAEAREKMAGEAQRAGFGRRTVQYRLKDWGISRQRYWGTPIPMLFCARCGVVPAREEDLPILLPENVRLDVIGASPLAQVPEFVNAPCPVCGGPARRETDTMDTFFDSSWYFYRYTDPRNDRAPFDRSRCGHWVPIDLYIGGIEHATLHLIYARFFARALRDMGLLGIDEPAARLLPQGMVIHRGAKMSKSKGNVVDPDAMVGRFGADTTRLFSLFAAPPERDLEWNEQGVEGCYRFIVRLWKLVQRARPHLPPPGKASGVDAGRSAGGGGGVDGPALALRRLTHRTIARVTQDLGERLHLNTAIAAIMELSNGITDHLDRSEQSGVGEVRLMSSPKPGGSKDASGVGEVRLMSSPKPGGSKDAPGVGDLRLDAGALREALETGARLLSPFAPHVAEEIWQELGRRTTLAAERWPEADPELLLEDQVTVVVQVNGRLRGRLDLPRGTSEESALSAARSDDSVRRHLNGRSIRKVVYVPDKLLNLVLS